MPQEPRDDRSTVQRVAFEETPLSLLISGLIFLYVGFGMNMRGVSGNALYDGSVSTFTWMSKLLGILFVAAWGLSLMKVPVALGVDLLSLLAAVGCLVIGGMWLYFGDSQGILLLIFGLINASAARGLLNRLLRRRT